VLVNRLQLKYFPGASTASPGAAREAARFHAVHSYFVTEHMQQLALVLQNESLTEAPHRHPAHSISASGDVSRSATGMREALRSDVAWSLRCQEAGATIPR
jgi:hypothetical protein